MKGIKRLLAVVLTAALLATLVAVPVTAAELEDPLKLETIGILKGTGNGVDAVYRASVPTRYQAAWLFLRLLGKEAVAKAWAGALNFTDASTAKTQAGNPLTAENKTMLAYLYAHKNLGFQGYADDTFRPFIEINAQMYYKLMLVALGYVENTDFTWDNVFAKCVEFGVTETAPTNDGVFNIDKLAQATVEALEAKLKNGTKTLIEKLVEDDKAVAADKAAQAGLYEGDGTTDPTDPPVDPPTAALAVMGVTTNNLGELTVTFNKPIGDATLSGGFTIGGAAATAELGANASTVIVTVPVLKRVPNGGSYTLSIAKSVKAADGTSLANEYTTTVSAFDSAYPSVIGVQLTGPRTFEITFSETLDQTYAGYVLVNNGAVGVSSAVIGNKKVTVTLVSQSLPEGEYRLTIAGFRDLAGYQMISNSDFTLGYYKDTTLPTVRVVNASQTEILIEFSKPVSNALNTTDYYHTFEHYTATSVSQESGNRYKLVFGTNPIPEGTTTLYIKNNNITDVWGNKMETRASIPVTVVADKTAPTVTDIKTSTGKRIDVYFSELVSESDARNAANYSVKLNVIATVPGSISFTTYVENNRTLCYASLNWSTALPGGTYTINVKNIYDRAYVPNKLVEYNGSIDIADLTPINTSLVTATLVSGAVNDIIYLTYPEAMNSTVLQKIYYRIKYPDLTEAYLGDTATIEQFVGNIYKITRPHDNKLTTNGLTKIVIGRVEDAAGNQPEQFSFDVTLTTESLAAVVPGSLEQSDYNKVSVQFDKVLTSALPAALYITVGAANYTAATVDSILPNGGKTLVSFTLSSAAVDAIKTVAGVNYETDSGQIIGNGGLAAIGIGIDGEYLTAATGVHAADTVLTGTAVDKRAPKLVSASLELVGMTVRAVFRYSEPLSAANQLFYANDLVVRETAAGNPLVAGLEYTTSVAGDSIKVEIVGKSAQGYYFGTKPSITYIRDNAGNIAAGFAQMQLNS